MEDRARARARVRSTATGVKYLGEGGPENGDTVGIRMGIIAREECA